jgi:hypothetical protein
VRVLGTVVEIPMLPMFHPWEKLSFCRAVAPQFISHDHSRHVRQPFEELTEEFLRGLLVPPPPHQDIQHVPSLIYCPPQIVMLALFAQGSQPLVTNFGTDPRLSHRNTLRMSEDILGIVHSLDLPEPGNIAAPVGLRPIFKV